MDIFCTYLYNKNHIKVERSIVVFFRFIYIYIYIYIYIFLNALIYDTNTLYKLEVEQGIFISSV